MKQRILGIPPHFSLILSLMLLTFYITDRFNTAMAFINHPMTKSLIVVLATFNLLSAVRLAFLKEKRTRPFRLIACSAWSLISLAAAILVYIDKVEPARILFTTEGVKTLLLVLAVVSILSALVLIVLQRIEAVKFAKTVEVKTRETESVEV